MSVPQIVKCIEGKIRNFLIAGSDSYYKYHAHHNKDPNPILPKFLTTWYSLLLTMKSYRATCFLVALKVVFIVSFIP